MKIIFHLFEGAGNTAEEIASSKPLQLHHFLTNKSQTYTSQFEEIASKYGLDLGDDWNTELLPHLGRHPNAYHDYMLDNIKEFDSIAGGDKETFLDLFSELKQQIVDNPNMLFKKYWSGK